MDPNLVPVFQAWKKGYKDRIKKPSRFKIPTNLVRMAALFTPGQFYFYIVNTFTFELEYVSPGVEGMLGINPEKTTMDMLLDMALPEVIPSIVQKEAATSDFFNRFLSEEERLLYKYVYTYPYKNHRGEKRDMMIQVSPLSLSEDGATQHQLGIHTDITHLGIQHNDTVSYFSIDEGKNYLNVSANKGVFDPSMGKEVRNATAQSLTKREREIAKLLAKGLNDMEIAEELKIAILTVRTHRRNMLKKTQCKNSVELVTLCLMCGMI
ncbi:hypothetical protein GO009_14565 [Muricauda sp. TY007]|uniref:response regulator transcription factor n=1 Tax=Allomuricauda sp. TY007 TaxID=2683200 RepID=UPI0013BFCF0F|nr:LuxR C-terminal-related transcriptional regulator [Muricauda sp. TY007]NDV17245.1 hypothetical protein [Muricauda sp. TY007]